MVEVMQPAWPLRCAFLVIALGLTPALSSRTAAAQDNAGQTDPMEVTTDTPDYCHKLLDRISEVVRLASAPVPREISDLTTDGQRMCAIGQTRGGIMRLRSALMALEDINGAILQ